MRKLLVAAALVAASVFGFAQDAQAHTGSGSATCTEATFNYVDFADRKTNTVLQTVLVNNKIVYGPKLFSFYGKNGSSTVALNVPLSNSTQTVTLVSVWATNGHVGSFNKKFKVECPLPPPPPPTPPSEPNRAGWCSPTPVLRADGTVGQFLDLPFGAELVEPWASLGLVPATVDSVTGAIGCFSTPVSTPPVTVAPPVVKPPVAKPKPPVVKPKPKPPVVKPKPKPKKVAPKPKKKSVPKPDALPFTP